MNTVNLASVKFSPKWFLMAIAAIIFVIAAWQIANWIFGKAREVTTGATKKVTGTTTERW